MTDWDQDDFELPPLPEVKLELTDVENPYIWQDEVAFDQKFSPPSEQSQPTPLKSIFHESDQHVEGGPGSVESDDEDLDLEKKFSPPPEQSQPASLKSIFHESDQHVEGGPSSMESDDEDLNLEKKMPRRQLKVGETFAPDVDHLTSMLKPDSGKPINLRARVWVCPNCKASYNGSRNFICDIQTYKCNHCDFQNPVSYSWSLTRVELNGVSLDFSKIYDQGKDDHCLVYAFLSLCDMMRRIRGARRGWDEATPFDHHLMLSLYKEVYGWDLDQSPFLSCDSGSNHPHIEVMLKTGVMHGVPYSSLTLFDRALLKRSGESLNIPKRSLKIKSWFRVDGGDIETITRLIGHGFPLLAIVPIGKCFRFLSSGEIYHPPSANDCIPQGPKDESCCVTHAVVLHGSAVVMPECKLSVQGNLAASIPCEGVYFKCRNCHGRMAHPSWEKAGEGADFNVWAADVFDDVYGIHLLDFDD